MPRVDVSILKYKTHKKSSDWSAEQFKVATATTEQRRPGRDMVGATLVDEPDTNRTQTEHKVDTNRAQNEHKEGGQKRETGHKPNTQPNTVPYTKPTQTEHKLDTNPVVAKLVGLQRKVLISVYRSCQITRSKVSEPLTIEYVASSLKMSPGSVKTTFARLCEKGFLKRESSKNGRGGWARYMLMDEVYSQLLQIETEHKLDTNRTQTEHKLDTQPYTQPNTSPLSSSSNLINSEFKNTTTTTTTPSDDDLPAGWRHIDCSPLVDNDCIIGKAQLRQLIAYGCDPAVVQESIYHYAFALERKWLPPGGFQTNRLNFFMGCLKNGKPFMHEAYVLHKAAQAEASQQFLKSIDDVKRRAAVRDDEVAEWFEGLPSDLRSRRTPMGLFCDSEMPVLGDDHIAVLKDRYLDEILGVGN